jgi:periplasmic protein TonB
MQRVDIFDIHEQWKGPITASLFFHGTIVGLVIAYGAWIGFTSHEWGGNQNQLGNAISVSLASPSSIPLPRDNQTDNIVANESPAVAHEEPKPKEIAPPEPKAVEIPQTTKIKPKEKQQEHVRERPQPVEQATNQVHVGQGGQVHQNFTTTTTDNSISVGASSSLVGGDFGNRYAYYVRTIAQILSQNWLKYEVDPHAMPNATVMVSFDISRNGQPTNVRVTESSGVPSLDTSAVRTLQRIDTFGPLPTDYRGSSLTVESQFRYTPNRR